MNIEIGDETADKIVLTNLKECIDYIKKDIKNLKKINKREKYQDEDLSNDQELLPHLEAVYDYFGGNLKHKGL
jgi:polysaccharide pyruvyl transferase WcaK-like protein